jgi:uncharacterized membrane protein
MRFMWTAILGSTAALLFVVGLIFKFAIKNKDETKDNRYKKIGMYLLMTGALIAIATVFASIYEQRKQTPSLYERARTEMSSSSY